MLALHTRTEPPEGVLQMQLLYLRGDGGNSFHFLLQWWFVLYNKDPASYLVPDRSGWVHLHQMNSQNTDFFKDIICVMYVFHVHL